MTTRSPLDWLAWLGHLTRFGLRVLPQTVRAVAHPNWWLKPFHGMTVGAMPLAAVTGLALGVVIWLHTRDVLARTGTGAVEYLPTFLSAAVLLELAPVGAGLIVAARTGASLGAELASMRVGEQLDALGVTKRVWGGRKNYPSTARLAADPTMATPRRIWIVWKKHPA